MSERLARLALERGWLALLVAALATVLLGAGILRLRWSSSPELLALRGSHELAEYRAWLERWGSDELVVLAYEVPDAFAPERLGQLRALTDALLGLEGVRHVASLTRAFRIDTGPFGPWARPLVPDPIGPDPQLRASALASPFLRDSLVSADGRTLLVAVQLEGAELENSAREQRVLEGIDRILADPAFADLDVHEAGSPVFSRELDRLNRRDNMLFTPLVVVGLAALLLFFFRAILPPLLALVLVGATVVCTLGAMGWLGVPLNLTTSLLPPLLMVIGVAESVHLLSGYLDRLRAGDDRRTALRWMLRELVPPSFWTSATTAAGFASLGLVQIASVQSFATFAVLGVLVAVALSVLAVPALLVRLPFERAAHRHRTPRPPRVPTRQRAALAVAMAGAALLLGATGLARLEVTTHDGEFFRASHPLNRAYRFIESRLEGATPLEVEIEAPAPGALASGPALRAIAALQEHMGRVPELTRGVSLVDLLAFAAPDVDLADDDAVRRALFWLESLAPEETRQWARDSYARGRISVRADAMTAGRSEALLAELRDQARRLFPPGWRVRFTGLVPVFSQMEQYLVDGQVGSWSVALLSMALCFAALLRSARLALIALVPNLVPVLLVGGLMGFAGIRLDVATVMVAAVALGVVDSDTIHLLHAFRRGVERGVPRAAAIERALALVARPAAFGSFALAGGFGVLGLSEFQPTAHFGLLVGLAVAIGLAADLAMVPELLLRFAPAAERLRVTAIEEVPSR